MTLLSIGDQIREGSYPLHSRFKRAVNFRNGSRLVSVVDEEVGSGPLNIVVSGLQQEDATPCASGLLVSQNVVAFGAQRLRFTDRQCYHSGIRLESKSSRHLRRNLSLFETLLTDISPPTSLAFLLDERRLAHFKSGFERAFVEQIANGVRHVFYGDLLLGIGLLKGCGVGLTPSGDDFIAGLLIGLHLLQKLHGLDFRSAIEAMSKAAAGENVFSNTFLELAGKGLLFGRMNDLVSALMQGDEETVRTSAERLFAVGGTSGADLGMGFFMTVREESGAIQHWGKRQNLEEAGVS
jgi:hypothetical protein